MLILAAKKLHQVDRRHFSYTQRTILCRTEFGNENKIVLLCNTSVALDSVHTVSHYYFQGTVLNDFITAVNLTSFEKKKHR